jgi:mannose-6-phosphate isomerase-like protein (cupin superfamily)
MKDPKVISEGQNFSALDIGELYNLNDYSYVHPRLHTEVKGKLFIGELLKATGAEVSFALIPPKTGIPFIHQHRKHEEIYIFLKGSGQFQVDDQLFDIKEGSVIRIAPDGKRTYKNTSDEPMLVMVIQSVAGSLSDHTISDGYRTKG